MVAELNPHHDSDNKESKSEDLRNDIKLIDLKDMLPSTARRRSLASELGNITLVNLLAKMENEYENVIVIMHEKVFFMPISTFLMQTVQVSSSIVYCIM